MARANPRLDTARKAYREALEAARANPTPEAWTRLLAAGKELSAAQEPKRSTRRPRRGAVTQEAQETGTESTVLPGFGEGTLDLEPTFD